MILSFVFDLAGQAVRHSGDAWDHPRVGFGARFLIVAQDLAGQGDPSRRR